MTDENLNAVKLRTPCCHRIVRSCALLAHAPIFVRRTCPRCGRAWQIQVKPILVDRNRGVAVHQADWVNASTVEKVKCPK